VTSIPSGVATALATGVDRRQGGWRGLDLAQGGMRTGEGVKRGMAGESRGKGGSRVSVCVEEGEERRGGLARWRAADNGPRPSGAGGAVPRRQGSLGGLTGGPWPQCQVVAPADR
jgi:hypothetical protein